jgi:hypothetical protein
MYKIQVNITVLSVSPVSIIPPMLHIYLHLYAVLTRRTNGRGLGTFQKQRSFANRGALDRQLLSTLTFETAQPEPLTPLTL